MLVTALFFLFSTLITSYEDYFFSDAEIFSFFFLIDELSSKV